MRGKTCEICGKTVDSKYERCLDCGRIVGFDHGKARLDSYFDEAGKLRREVFQGPPEVLSNVFKRAGLSYGMLRRFLQMVRRAIESEDFQDMKAQLGRVKRFATYQMKRNAIPDCFGRFLISRIELCVNSKSREETQGFFELLKSIVAYSVEKERRN